MSFWELFLVFVVALLVLGPKQLPTAAVTLGRLFAKARKASTDLQASIEQQLKFEQLQQNELRAAQADEKYKNNNDETTD